MADVGIEPSAPGERDRDHAGRGGHSVAADEIDLAAFDAGQAAESLGRRGQNDAGRLPALDVADREPRPVPAQCPRSDDDPVGQGAHAVGVDEIGGAADPLRVAGQRRDAAVERLGEVADGEGPAEPAGVHRREGVRQISLQEPEDGRGQMSGADRPDADEVPNGENGIGLGQGRHGDRGLEKDRHHRHRAGWCPERPAEGDGPAPVLLFQTEIALADRLFAEIDGFADPEKRVPDCLDGCREHPADPLGAI
jgi:hypothetical protein